MHTKTYITPASQPRPPPTLRASPSQSLVVLIVVLIPLPEMMAAACNVQLHGVLTGKQPWIYDED